MKSIISLLVVTLIATSGCGPSFEEQKDNHIRTVAGYVKKTGPEVAGRCAAMAWQNGLFEKKEVDQYFERLGWIRDGQPMTLPHESKDSYEKLSLEIVGEIRLRVDRKLALEGRRRMDRDFDEQWAKELPSKFPELSEAAYLLNSVSNAGTGTLWDWALDKKKYDAKMLKHDVEWFERESQKLDRLLADIAK